MFRFSQTCCFCFLAILSFFAKAQTTNEVKTFYIVRHAEKDTGSNPPLSPAGQLRAGRLYNVLKDKHIDKIYSTKYRRTEMTGDSTRIYANVAMEFYAADITGNGLIERMALLNEAGKNILIIGHSNTVPAIIRRLGAADFLLKEIPEDEFDNLYIVTVQNGIAQVKSEKYGDR